MKNRIQSFNIVGEHFFKTKSEARQHPCKVNTLFNELGNTSFTRASRWRNWTHFDDVADLFAAVILRTEVHLE